MKLRKGKAKYRLPAYSKVLEVRLEGNQRHNQLCALIIQIVNPTAIDVYRDVGIPTVCAVYKDTIEFSPPPDNPYLVTVRYLPPVMEC
jgi:hypothetical protein